MELCLPAAQELNLNPSLLTGFLEEKFGLPAASAGILRKKLPDGGSAAFCLISRAKNAFWAERKIFGIILGKSLAFYGRFVLSYLGR